jgi:hypothetical protein
LKCNNDSCLITDKKSESFSFVVAHDTQQLNFSFVTSLGKEIPQGFQFVPAKGADNKQLGPPFYLSILRI